MTCPHHPTVWGSPYLTDHTRLHFQGVPHLMAGGWCGLKPQSTPRVAPATLRASQKGLKTTRGVGGKPHSPFMAGFADSYNGPAISEREIHQDSKASDRPTQRPHAAWKRTCNPSALNPEIHGVNHRLPCVYPKREKAIIFNIYN